MRSAFLILLVTVGACSTGVTPPEPTAMAEITTGLTFTFGVADFATEGFCTDPLTAIDRQPSCTSATSTSLPLVWPPVEVTLQPFAIDVHEVTNIQYQYCVADGGCTEPAAGNAASVDQRVYYDADRYEQYPVVNITWDQAAAYCAFVDARLPTEAEWERVAKGPDPLHPRRFPTDNITSSITECQQAGFNGQYCRGDQRMDAVMDPIVGAKDFVTEGSQKIYMMFGNAAEWVSTSFKEDVQCQAPPPCTREDQCLGDAQCITDAKNCPACDASTPCYYLCDGSPKKTILCEAIKAAEQPLTGAKFEERAVGVDKVYRGGYVSLVGAANSYALCQFRTSRSNAKPLPFRPRTESQPWLGFRCARDL